MKSTYSEAGMRDASLRLKGTRVIELPVISRFGTRASRGISQEGTLFFWRPEILKNCSIFVSRGTDLGVNR